MLSATTTIKFDAPGAVRGPSFVPWVREHRGAVAMAGLLAFAGPVTFLTGALSVMREPTAANIAWLTGWWLLYGVTLWFFLLATGHALMVRAQRFGRGARVVLGALAACLAAVATSLLTAGRATVVVEQGLAYSNTTMHAHGFIVSVTMALLYFEHLRRSREHEQAAARLAVAQAAQRHARRRIVQARVQEVQARIDPQMLFKMLDTVRRLYEGDAGRAEHFFDELIVFLRAALPRVRAASSSVSREVELARALVGLHALAAVHQLEIAIDVSAEASHARFPPGVLLPLLDSAIGGGAVSLLLAATCTDGAIRLVLTLDEPPSDAELARVRGLLHELYEGSATLDSEISPGIVRIVFRVPHEHT